MKKSFLFLLMIMGIQQPGSAQIGNSSIGMVSVGYDNMSSPVIGKASTEVCAMPGTCGGPCIVYTFIGSGLWSIEGNWLGGLMPPAVLSGCSQIIINPAGNQECLLNIPLQILPPGTGLTVMTGKKFRIPGKLVRN